MFTEALMVKQLYINVCVYSYHVSLTVVSVCMRLSHSDYLVCVWVDFNVSYREFQVKWAEMML